jgi:hypothetical protein
VKEQTTPAERETQMSRKTKKKQMEPLKPERVQKDGRGRQDGHHHPLPPCPRPRRRRALRRRLAHPPQGGRDLSGHQAATLARRDRRTHGCSRQLRNITHGRSPILSLNHSASR